MKKPRIRVFTLMSIKKYFVNSLALEYIDSPEYFTHVTALQANYFLPKTEEDHELHLKNIGQ